MKLQAYDDMLCRVELMVTSKLYNLSDKDRAAIAAVLEERAWLIAELDAKDFIISNLSAKARAGKTESSEPLDWEKASEMCDAIYEMCDDVPARGQAFADSVRVKVVSIQQTIINSESVSDAQQAAIENMLAGVRKWVS